MESLHPRFTDQQKSYGKFDIGKKEKEKELNQINFVANFGRNFFENNQRLLVENSQERLIGLECRANSRRPRNKISFRLMVPY